MDSSSLSVVSLNVPVLFQNICCSAPILKWSFLGPASSSYCKVQWGLTYAFCRQYFYSCRGPAGALESAAGFRGMMAERHWGLWGLVQGAVGTMWLAHSINKGRWLRKMVVEASWTFFLFLSSGETSTGLEALDKGSVNYKSVGGDWTDKKSMILERREAAGPLVQIQRQGKGPLFSERRGWVKPLFALVWIFLSSLDCFCKHHRDLVMSAFPLWYMPISPRCL